MEFSDNSKMTPIKKPNCLKCQFFQISWEPQHPRICKKFGFKGKEMPSQTVFETTGHHCPFFRVKTHFEKDSSENNTIS